MSGPMWAKSTRGAFLFSFVRSRRRGIDSLSGLLPVPRRPIIDMSYSAHFIDFKRSSIPSSMKKVVVNKLSPNFREAASVQTVPVPTPADGDLLVRNRFVGINASDINYSAGRYDPTVQPPFDAGFEGIGEVVGLGLSASSRYTVGDTVAYFSSGAFAEYTVVPAKESVPVPSVKPEFLTLLVSGATAYIALKRLGDLAKGKTVLVTAAAGGTGQFAVQFAKQAGCHVIGTCSSDEKAGFLKSIGCDRPINYKVEDLAKTLKTEYPKGIDVVYESVGGSTLELAINSLAKKGQLIIIGFISGYQSASGIPQFRGATVPVKLLQKSASIRGFFLPHFISDYREALTSMMQMFAMGKLMCEVDYGDLAQEGRFVGLESVFRAVDYMYAGKNLGKVVVEVTPLSNVNSKL
ncbi:prostaglandin reductase 3-like [Corythoichthys intestinalis]|uniref:prostaglandin reductase 3-like n=1 Tax=Corythoichthys intestinalis TaxID=161448 RepID=UPI0025A6544D|nr:prostaglandin reductase 3-like [Corythoichthys intestinalis]XP_061788902.1 prostaglandin reductase 3-like [Nerophis lumbriciformis]